MIKRYNQFVKGKVNEELFISGPNFDMGDMETPIVEEPITDTESEVEEDPETELPEEEGGEYQGQILLNQLANELGTEVDADGSINYEGKKINFYSETEKFHVDNKKFSTPEEVVAYLGGSNEAPEHTHTHENEEEHSHEDEEGVTEIEDEEDDWSEEGAFESKSYRHTRLKKFGK
jgi:hypothetical protein